MSFQIPSRTSSYLELYNSAVAFVQGKSDAEKFKDHYASGLGTLELELQAGFSEFRAFEAYMARREAYLQDAVLRTSAIGIAQTLGYSSHRGNNVHLQLNFIPASDASIKPYTIVGKFGEYDIVALDEMAIRYGETSTLNVVLGKLKNESLIIQGSKYFVFRFLSEDVSEDIQVSLNGVIVPLSREILSLNLDYWVVMSNSMDSVDLWYLNRFPPMSWFANFRYNFTEYINPNYDWRRNWGYFEGQHCTAKGDRGVFYRCMRTGTTGLVEPGWAAETGKTTVDGTVIWRAIGPLPKNIFFKSITPGIGYTGSVEPIWPISVGEKLIDNDVEWLATDIYEVSKFPYVAGDRLDLTFVELANITVDTNSLDLYLGTIESAIQTQQYQDKEAIDSIKINAPLYHETKGLVRGREDYRKLFRMITPNIVDVNGFDLSPAVVQLTYVKNHTALTWEPGVAVTVGTEIFPMLPGEYFYKALNTGRTAVSFRGLSSKAEPDWSQLTKLGSTFLDGQIVWTVESIVGSPQYWQPNTEYGRNDIVRGSLNNGCHYKATHFFTEPFWPRTIGATVQDNSVTWRCEGTIYLGGYDAEFRRPDKEYEVNDFVEPVVENGYFYRCTVAGVTSAESPIEWPTTLADTVIDGTVVWECYDRIDSPLYTKNNVLRELSDRRPYGVEPPTMIDPQLVGVRLYVYYDMRIVKDQTTVSNNTNLLLQKYERNLGIRLSIQDLEDEFEQSLGYVRIARVKAVQETKSKTWEPGVSVTLNDVVRTKDEEPAYFYAARIIDTREGWTQWEDRGLSGTKEPIWDTTPGSVTLDRNLYWRAIPLGNNFAPSLWEPNKIYLLGEAVSPTTGVSAGLFYTAEYLKQVEPKWPENVGSSVLDNNVFWVKFDPSVTIVPLTWREYYIFSVVVEMSNNFDPNLLFFALPSRPQPEMPKIPEQPITLTIFPSDIVPKCNTPTKTSFNNSQYIATLSWSPSIAGGKWDYETVYTVTILITPLTGWTLDGVGTFTVEGNTDLKVISKGAKLFSIVFPKTCSSPVVPPEEPSPISDFDIYVVKQANTLPIDLDTAVTDLSTMTPVNKSVIEETFTYANWNGPAWTGVDPTFRLIQSSGFDTSKWETPGIIIPNIGVGETELVHPETVGGFEFTAPEDAQNTLGVLTITRPIAYPVTFRIMYRRNGDFRR